MPHYTCSIQVRLPRERMLQLLMNRNNDIAWRPDVTLCEEIAGEPGESGSETRFVYGHLASGASERVEHITACRLPDSLELEVTSPKVVERQVHRFVDEPAGSTTWSLESEVLFHHTALGRRHRSAVLESETYRAMQAFKSFAESRSAAVIPWSNGMRREA